MKPFALFLALLLVAATTAAPTLAPTARQRYTLTREEYRELQRRMQAGTFDFNQFITWLMNRRAGTSAEQPAAAPPAAATPAPQPEPASASASNSAPQPAPASSSMADDILAVHNMERDLLNISPLSWSADLVRTAQSWADVLAAESGLRHSPRDRRPDSGENLWRGSGRRFSYTEMVRGWADEKGFFVPGIFPEVTTGGVVGHYTQMIWRTTREIGCATAGQVASGVVLVCHYKPAGNFIGTRVP